MQLLLSVYTYCIVQPTIFCVLSDFILWNRLFCIVYSYVEYLFQFNFNWAIIKMYVITNHIKHCSFFTENHISSR